MVCYHPLKAFVIGQKEDGTKLLKIRPYKEEFIYLNGKTITEYIEIPCGKCIGCNIKKSKEWANRLMLELKYHDRACFITLTYNDDYLPKSHYVDSDGVVNVSYTLVKKDFQDFMKRLRKKFSDIRVRFYACGEYGSKTKRPHYHAIIFGVDFSEDRYKYSISKEGFVSYRSDTLEKLWPFGYSLINEVNWNTCAYVSRYVTKKYYGSQNIYYQTFNIIPEFSLMSRRPGIGKQYFDDHKDEIYRNQEIFLINNKGGLKVSPPKYYDKLYEIEYPEEMEVIKENRRKMSEIAKQLKLEQTSLDYLELLEVEEKNFQDKIRSLKREGV